MKALLADFHAIPLEHRCHFVHINALSIHQQIQELPPENRLLLAGDFHHGNLLDFSQHVAA